MSLEGQKALLQAGSSSEVAQEGQPCLWCPQKPPWCTTASGHTGLETGHPKLWPKGWEVEQEISHARNRFWSSRNWRKNPGTCCRNAGPCCFLVACRPVSVSKQHTNAVRVGTEVMPKLRLWGILQKIAFSFSNSLSRRRGVMEVGRVNPGTFWESAGMKSPWWGPQDRQALRLLEVLCPVTPMTLALLLRIYIPGSLEGRGGRKGAQGVCQLRGQVVWGKLLLILIYISLAATAAHSRTQLTGKNTKKMRLSSRPPCAPLRAGLLFQTKKE